MPIPLTPEEQALVNGYWGIDSEGDGGGSAGGLPAPTYAAPISADSAGGLPPPAPIPPQDMSGGSAGGVGAPVPTPPNEVSVPYLPDDEARVSSYWGGQSLDPAFKQGAAISSPKPAPAAPMPVPSAEEDAALTSVVSKRTPQRGVNGTANPDPYGRLAAEKAELGAYDDMMGATQAMGDAAAVKQANQAEGLASLARIQQEDAAIANAERELAHKHFNESMSEIGRQLDDVRSKKVDPLKDFKESPALGVLSVIGGLVSGFYQGMTGGQKNQFLEDLDRQIDRGIAAQEEELKTEKFVLGETQNMLGQQRLMQKDNDLAAMQMRNLAYEAVKQDLIAQGQRDDIPGIKAKTAEGIAQLELPQAQLRDQIARRREAAAAAAAAHQMASAKERQAAFKEFYKDNIDKGGMTPLDARDAALHLVDLIYANNGAGTSMPGGRRGANGVDPVMAAPKERRDEAAKEFAAHSTAERGIASVGSAFSRWNKLPMTAGPGDRDRAAIKSNIKAAYKAGLGPGFSSETDTLEFLDPLTPAYGDSPETLANKRALIEESIRSKVATPTLDAYAKGWKAPTREEKRATLGATPVK